MGNNLGSEASTRLILKKFARGGSPKKVKELLEDNISSLSSFKGELLKNYIGELDELMLRRGIELKKGSYAYSLLNEKRDKATLYDFLLALAHDEAYSILPLIRQVKSAKYPDDVAFKRQAQFFAVIGVIGTIIVDPKHLIQFSIKGIETLAPIAQIGVLGGAFNALYSLYQAANILLDPTKTVPKKIVDLSFLTISTVLNSFAYINMIQAAGVISSSTAVLFILASAVELLQNVCQLIKAYYEMKQVKEPHASSSPEERVKYMHAMLLFKRRQATVLTSLLAATLATVVMAGYVLFPPSMLITAIAVVSFIAILAIKSYISSKIKDTFDEKLQKVVADSMNQQVAITPQDLEQDFSDTLYENIIHPLASSDTTELDEAEEYNEEYNPEVLAEEGSSSARSLLASSSSGPLSSLIMSLKEGSVEEDERVADFYQQKQRLEALAARHQDSYSQRVLDTSKAAEPEDLAINETTLSTKTV